MKFIFIKVDSPPPGNATQSDLLNQRKSKSKQNTATKDYLLEFKGIFLVFYACFSLHRGDHNFCILYLLLKISL